MKHSVFALIVFWSLTASFPADSQKAAATSSTGQQAGVKKYNCSDLKKKQTLDADERDAYAECISDFYSTPAKGIAPGGVAVVPPDLDRNYIGINKGGIYDDKHCSARGCDS